MEKLKVDRPFGLKKRLQLHPLPCLVFKGSMNPSRALQTENTF